MYSQIHFAKVTSDFNDEQSLLTMEVDLVKPTTIISFGYERTTPTNLN